jgi:hypothetical protein
MQKIMISPDYMREMMNFLKMEKIFVHYISISSKSSELVHL